MNSNKDSFIPQGYRILLSILVSDYGYKIKDESFTNLNFNEIIKMLGIFSNHILDYYSNNNTDDANTSLKKALEIINHLKNNEIFRGDYDRRQPWIQDTDGISEPLYKFLNDYNNFIEEMVKTYNSIVTSIKKEQELDELKKEEEVKNKEKKRKIDLNIAFNKLINKWVSKGFNKDLLSCPIIYSVGVYNEGGGIKLVELIDQLKGKLVLEKKNNLYILHQTNIDDVTGKKSKFDYAFVINSKKGVKFLFLDRLIINGNELSKPELSSFINGITFIYLQNLSMKIEK